jgi:hypothetical protein
METAMTETTTEMTANHTAPRQGMRGSAALLWRRRRLLWWLFALNLATAWLASLPLRSVLHAVLDRSLAAQRLVDAFDLPTYFLLRQQPQVPGAMLAPGASVAAGLYLLLAVILGGGLVRELLEDRKLNGQEFAATCSAFFWRMVRLTLYSAVVLGVVLGIGAAVTVPLNKLAEHFADARIGASGPALVRLFTLMAALLVRQWFDVAQARLVRANERKILRELWRSFLPSLRSGLYRQYVGIAVLAAASFAAGLWAWAMLPHASMFAAFLVLELVTLAQIAARLWMKAAAARWVALQPEPAGWYQSLEEPLEEEAAAASLPQSQTLEADLPATE